jgi:hypothetical protein
MNLLKMARLRGRTEFMQRTSRYMALEERGLVKVCRYDRARWIHADTAPPKKRRIQLGLYKQFQEDSYRHGGDDE